MPLIPPPPKPKKFTSKIIAIKRGDTIPENAQLIHIRDWPGDTIFYYEVRTYVE